MSIFKEKVVYFVTLSQGGSECNWVVSSLGVVFCALPIGINIFMEGSHSGLVRPPAKRLS